MQPDSDDTILSLPGSARPAGHPDHADHLDHPPRHAAAGSRQDRTVLDRTAVIHDDTVPHRGTERIRGGELLVERPRGPILRVLIGSDHVVELETPVLIGRAPRRPRISAGALPQLVRVPSPHGEVSSTHVELRQVGAAVLVTDLRSTNGTRVTAPGAASRLVQGESVAVAVGTLIDLGDDTFVQILAPTDGESGA